MRDAFGACRRRGVRRCSSSRSSTRCGECCADTRRRTGRSPRLRSRRGFSLDTETVDAELAALEREDGLVRGELRPGGSEREWCDPEVLRRIRRATLAVLRREVEPAGPGCASGASFRRGTGSVGVRTCARRSFRFRASRSRPRSGRATSCPRRVPSFQAGRSGRAMRLRRGGMGRSRPRPRRRLLPRRRPLLGPPPVDLLRERRAPPRYGGACRACAVLGRSRRATRLARVRTSYGALGARVGGRSDE